MTLASMTGFARAEGADGTSNWGWEVRSVNGRGLDVRCRVPAGMDGLEGKVRSLAGERFKRGNINATLSVSRAEGAGDVSVNHEVLEKITEVAKEIGKAAGVEPPLQGILAVRGVLDFKEVGESEDGRQAREAAMTATLEQAMDELAKVRGAEGAHTAKVLFAALDELGKLVAEAAATAATQPETIRARITKQVEELMEAGNGLSEERLAQEVALLAGKADVREELDRLEAHVAAARELMAGDEAVGRRLDFLSQEFNREANTLCSKSTDMELTRIGLDLKTVIDRFKEQVANVE